MLVKCKNCKKEFYLEDDIFLALFERKETLFCSICLSWDDICEGCEHYKTIEFCHYDMFYCELHPNYINLYCKEKR